MVGNTFTLAIGVNQSRPVWGYISRPTSPCSDDVSEATHGRTHKQVSPVCGPASERLSRCILLSEAPVSKCSTFAHEGCYTRCKLAEWTLDPRLCHSLYVRLFVKNKVRYEVLLMTTFDLLPDHDRLLVRY